MSHKLSQPSKPSKVHDVDFPRTHWAYVIASFFWVGRLKPASGTWGSLAALPFGLFILFSTGALGLMVATLLTLTLGVHALDHIEKNQKTPSNHDAGVFVIDEVVGQWLTLQALPVLFILGMDFTLPSLLFWVSVCFVTFRLCDILKPWPCKYIDTRMQNGWGVMLDDVMAGFQAFGLTLALYFILAYTGLSLS